MAPTNLEKAEADREVQTSQLQFFMGEIARHATQPLTPSEVEYFLQKVTTLEREVTETHRRIVGCGPEEIAPHVAVFKVILGDIAKASCQLMALRVVSTNGSSNNSNNTNNGNNSTDVRLPRLELPKFDGDLNSWISFKDQFMAAVQVNTKLSNAQKLTYLKSSLRGDAAKILGSLASTDGNYEVAWKSLRTGNVHAESASSLRSLIDVSKECIRSLETLRVPVEHWDVILVFIMLQKLDVKSRQEWELSLTDTTVPKLEPFLEFLEQRARALASGAIGKSTAQADMRNNGETHHHRHKTLAHHAKPNNSCKFCAGSHRHFECTVFLAMDVPQRRDAVRGHGLCFNCLGLNHEAAKCRSDRVCRTCKEKHHSLIHLNKAGVGKTRENQPNPTTCTALTFHSKETQPTSHGMLATAIVLITDRRNQPQLCRAFLDSGSTTSFITDRCVKRLGLPRSCYSAPVTGLGTCNVGSTSGLCKANIGPHFTANEWFPVSMAILPTITTKLPTHMCDRTQWNHLDGLTLADPQFHKPAEVDILLGSEVFWDLLLDGKRVGPIGSPTAINSKLGWLVAGARRSSTPFEVQVHHAEIPLDQTLQKFWELENVPAHRILTAEEKKCEEHFAATTTRDADGRYVVSFPFRPNLQLGATRDMAMRRLLSLEKRLARNPVHYAEYLKFMKEYETLGHMERIELPLQHSSLAQPCYIPHHFVLKEDSTTTKFRVVFDASAKASNGFSLNDNLLVGPTIQEGLVQILMRFRIHAIAFTADICKMYRQIIVNPAEQDYQRILWRENPKDQASDYRLLTVTYGTASAPFHATRVLQQLAMDEKISFPLASAVAARDFYMDDLMSGATTVEAALSVQKELLELTKRGKMDLRKWSSNSPELLASLPPELRETQIPLSFDSDGTVKTLGLHWNPGFDQFSFKVNLQQQTSGIAITKRVMLSEMAKVFDPLGWLAPVVIRAKIMFQRLWKTDIGWDDPLPEPILEDWISYRCNLKKIEKIKIERCILLKDSRTSLLGFSDASEQAYSAVVYTKSYNPNGEIKISLVASKTRVAPTKQVSLPRLELCGAVLLVRLMRVVEEALHLEIFEKNAFTDSTIVLAWLHGQPTRWKTFVANRVAEIQEHESVTWNHVIGLENPADCASRGIDPSELKTHPLWWHGPEFIMNSEHKIKPSLSEEESFVVQGEERKLFVATTALVNHEMSLLLHKCSRLNRLRRITAWCLRFVHNCRLNKQRENVTRWYGELSAEEVDSSLFVWIKFVQSIAFEQEIQCIRTKSPLPTGSKIIALNPFLDSTGVLRVGGRLRHAQLLPDQKTPILLPRHNRLTALLIAHEHERSFHGGPQLLLALIRARFWIVGAKDAIRHQLKKCIRCTRMRASTAQQFMGDLPAARVTPTRPFLTSGIDYAGPFVVRAIPSRSKVTFKAYLALFICFSTRAVHLEVVSSLSTDAFLAALRRFIARRGKCQDLYSDCGTNFVGAAREMQEFLALIKSSSHNSTVSSQLASDGIRWHFNPPGAPHFGGLWEAGVKSVKYHLHRVIGQTRLTFEELTTVMTQIEACLNSRPLTPCSTSPDDFTALTPAHFLIGESLLAMPEPDLTNTKVNRLSRWQQSQQLLQHFWRRWSKEFLTRLQQRPKWLKHRENIRVGDMVLIKHENLPPLQWKLGRVTIVHPGDDGEVRVATVKTSEGELKRPITKLCLLPIDESAEESNV